MTKQRREQEGENRRRLRRALLWSLVAHGLVFGIGLNVPLWQESVANGSPAEIPLVAHLNRTTAVPAPQKTLAFPRHAVTSAMSIPSAGAPITVPPAPTFAMPTSVSDGVAAETKSQVAAVPASGAPSASSAVALDADALGSYKLLLAAQARRFKRYPAQAQAAGWAGTAEIRLAIARGGQPQPAELEKSSGQDALDRAALAMIDAAAQRTELPPALQGQAFAITLPVEFRLEDR